jgi:OPA family glycerol-3-phosphate transporter-like MFS transporter 1/2
MSRFSQPMITSFVPKISAYFSLKELTVYRVIILMTTFTVYMSYHLSRRSLSVVKPELNHRNCSELPSQPPNVTDEYWCDWKPFEGQHSRSLLGK